MPDPRLFWFLLGFCAGACLMAAVVAFARDELRQRVSLQVDNKIHLDPAALAQHIADWLEQKAQEQRDDQEGSWKDQHDDLYGGGG